MFFKKLITCLALITALLPAGALDRDHYQSLMKKLGERARAKDWQGARDVLTEVGRELPAPTPRYLLLVASMEARLGHKEEAMQWLDRFAATGLNFDIARDEELKGLLNDEAGRKIAARIQENQKPI